jgi:hypothetical protein
MNHKNKLKIFLIVFLTYGCGRKSISNPKPSGLSKLSDSNISNFPTVDSEFFNVCLRIRPAIILLEELTSMRCYDIKAHNLAEIRSLSLPAENLGDFKKEDLSGLRLHDFYVVDPKIKWVDPEVLSGFEFNRILITSKSYLRIADRFFAGHKELRTIFIKSEIESIGNFAFKGLENLNEIFIAKGGRMTKFDSDIFSDLPNLERLNVGFGSGVKLSENFLSKSKKLNYLNVDCDDCQVSEDLLRDQKQLTFLYLGTISNQPANLFKNNTELSFINLKFDFRKNKKGLNDMLFAGLANLNSVNLSVKGLKFDQWPANLFSPLIELNHLNKISIFSDSGEIDSTEAFEAPQEIKKMSHLTYLNIGISNGRIPRFPEDYFSKLSSLQDLSLGAHLEVLQDNLFDSLIQLKSFSVSFDKKYSSPYLASGLLKNSSQLESIFMNGMNQFKTMPVGFFSHSKKLRTIMINCAQFSEFEMNRIRDEIKNTSEVPPENLYIKFGCEP